MDYDANELWKSSAAAWIKRMDQGDPYREHLLDPVVLELCGDVRGKRALDVGCGEGRFCRMMAERGAEAVGIDPTAALIDTARQRHPGGTYLAQSAEAIDCPEARFDLVISYLSLVDIADYRAGIGEMCRVTRPGGRVLLANLNAHVTATGGWCCDEAGQRRHYGIDRYLEETCQIEEWHGIRVAQYHRPLSAIMTAFIDAGMRLEAYREPQPSPDVMKRYHMHEVPRVGLFYVMAWRKETADGR